MPRVSLIMPVFNAIADFERGNGKFMLPEALACIQDQTFSDFELIILDNISTDGTFEFLKNYTFSDERIRLVQDTVRRNPEEAISYLSTLVASDYCCIVNDDDRWDKDFLASLYAEITTGEYDVVYPGGYFMDIDSNLEAPLIGLSNPAYDHDDDRLSNFTKFLKARNPIPISFGMFRSSLFKKLYPTGTFDIYRANVDNQFILRVLMSDTRIKFLNSELFYYRNKIRVFNPSKEFGLTVNASPVEVLESLILHQIKFTEAILKDIKFLISRENQESYIVASVDSLRLYIWKMLFFVLEQSRVKKEAYECMLKICFAVEEELLKLEKHNVKSIVGLFQGWANEVSRNPSSNVLGHSKRATVMNLLPLGQRVQLHYLGYRLMRFRTRLASRPRLNTHR